MDAHNTHTHTHTHTWMHAHAHTHMDAHTHVHTHTHLHTHTHTGTLACPICTVPTSLSEQGVGQLPRDLRKSFESDLAKFELKIRSQDERRCDRCVETKCGKAVVFCIDCCEDLCELCLSDHKRARKTVDHRILDVHGLQAGGDAADEIDFGESLFARSAREKPLLCESHRDEKLIFFCQSCSILVCRDCITIDHSNHMYDHIDKVFGKVQLELKSSLEKIQEAEKKIQVSVGNGSKVIESYKANQETVRVEICTAFETLQLELSKRKEKLLSLSSQITADKVSTLASQYDNLDKLKQELSRVLELVSTATTTVLA